MNSEVFLLLGSNLGNTHQNLEHARQKLSLNSTLLATSSVYKTAAWGKTDQPDFFNQVLMVATSLNPTDLLKEVLSIEIEIGRERKEKWGPRIIDIDILFYSNSIISQENLSIPHPGIPDRLFVLKPMAEIASDFVHPVLKKKIATLLAECPDNLKVERCN